MIKHLYYAGIICAASLFLVSCVSTKEKPAPAPAAAAPAPVPVAVPAAPAPVDDEYLRSTSQIQNGATITKDVFQEDKKAILEIISQLDTVMKNIDYSRWLTYIEPDSIAYWRDPKKLRKAAERLPVKGISLDSLQDYFRFVFIPSRAGRVVDEIRYVSDSSVKAVQVNGNTDVIYYNFVKIDGKWMIHLPALES